MKRRRNGTYKNKHRELAKQLFSNAMDIDTNDIRRQRNGLYYYYPLPTKFTGNITKTIDIILFDTRYFAKPNGPEDILGTEQWIWLHRDLALIISENSGRKEEKLGWDDDWFKKKVNEDGNDGNVNGNGNVTVPKKSVDLWNEY